MPSAVLCFDPAATWDGVLQATWHKGYWASDMQHVCFHGWHLGVSLGLGLPSLILLGIGIPMLFAFIVFRHRRALQEDFTREKLGYAYRSYKSVF